MEGCGWGVGGGAGLRAIFMVVYSNPSSFLFSSSPLFFLGGERLSGRSLGVKEFVCPEGLLGLACSCDDQQGYTLLHTLEHTFAGDGTGQEWESQRGWGRNGGVEMGLAQSLFSHGNLSCITWRRGLAT